MDDFEEIRKAWERREELLSKKKKVDWVGRVATILSVIAWVFAFAVWAVLEAAAPERELRFITSLMQIHYDSPIYVRQQWNETLFPIAFGLLLAALAICILTFLLDALRLRKNTGKHRKSIFILGGGTIVGIIMFLLLVGYPY
ncbi:MAG: hypothetical protein FWB97_08455 [Oscillospiraceae bacterium]|nr:hypothetical protein [Oscillospiraceae bacterium]